jgi:PAS domain S-box-containing protein
MAYRCQYNPSRTMEFMSKGTHALTGFHSWDLVNNPLHSYSSLIHEDDIDNCWLQIQKACKHNLPYKINYRIKRADNSQRWVQDQGQAVFSNDGGEIIALEGFAIDITDSKRAQETQQRINEQLEHRVEERTSELKRAIAQLQNEICEKHRVEEQLRISEASLRNAQRIANLGSWDKNIITQTHSYSDEIYRMTNVAPKDINPHEDIWTPHIHGDDVNRVLKERESCLINKTPISIEYKIVLNNGEQRFIQERSETTTNDDGEPLNIATTVLDITESKRIQEELIRYREHLQELVDAQTKDIVEARDAALAAERAMSAFIANMSHEIRTPLHGILSFSNFGLKKIDTADRKKLQGYFEEIHESGETLLLLLNDLLDLSKLKAGKMMYDYQEADLVQIIQLAIKEFSILRTEKNISLCVNSPNSLIGRFDKDKIRQVIRNLLSNSIKFSPDNATIELCARDTLNGDYEIAIRDQGPGIPENELSEIFNPFVQSSKTRSKAGGTGLGLAICKEIIESGHAGSIIAKNNPDTGATFYVRIAKQPRC